MAESKEVCFVKAVGLFLVGAKKGEDPYRALLLVDPLDALNTALVTTSCSAKLRSVRYCGILLSYRGILLSPLRAVVTCASAVQLNEPSAEVAFSIEPYRARRRCPKLHLRALPHAH